jgi:hypothetical protein
VLLVPARHGTGRSEVALGLRCISTLYAAVLFAATLADVVIAWTTRYGSRTGVACNFYDALLVGVECRGFPGSGFVEIVLWLPLLMYQVTALVPSWPLMLVPAVLLWSPVVYLAYGAWRRTSEA